MTTVSSDAATVRSLKNSVNGYYEALDEVCSALLVDQDFDIKLHGFGFDKIGIAVTSRAGWRFSTDTTRAFRWFWLCTTCDASLQSAQNTKKLEFCKQVCILIADFYDASSVTSLTGPIEAIRVVRGYGTQAYYVHRNIVVTEVHAHVVCASACGYPFG